MRWLKLIVMEEKETQALAKFRVYCKNCGHSMLIADDKKTNGKKICTHCGTMNYSKKRNFREEMLKRLGNGK